ncbi:unnamed protein product [Ostreobium quekettii]|uniref:Ribosomal RNA-processing protein 43 n=1 Tax=Ostreobium quekettii TaxID=121088 RepID=A0A8S1JDW1_9CHLO|nr:unnamed protein product [Ostreobium quekettii]|eukprot:evm.model.scf_381.4 EVM.evm.TU.scf_381.4   scf_381:50028-51095(+)
MSVEADAFKALYPDQYLLKFLANGVRPDGRSLSRCRPTTVGFEAVSDVDASALVKIGSTTALATVGLEIVHPNASAAAVGATQVTVNVTRLCDAEVGGRQTEWGDTLGCRAQRVLDRARLVDPEQLRVGGSPACWSIGVDVNVLDADGAVFDAVLLACVSALSGVRLPAGGDVVLRDWQDATRRRRRREKAAPLRLSCCPVSLTCGVMKGHVVADPTAEEEAVMGGFVTVVVDGSGDVLGLSKVGQGDLQAVNTCINIAKARHKQTEALLNAALADVPVG